MAWVHPVEGASLNVEPAMWCMCAGVGQAVDQDGHGCCSICMQSFVLAEVAAHLLGKTHIMTEPPQALRMGQELRLAYTEVGYERASGTSKCRPRRWPILHRLSVRQVTSTCDRSQVTYSSGYFEELHAFAVQLICGGNAYVCHQTPDEIKESRERREPSPWRDRLVEESLRLFEDMRRGLVDEGKATLRCALCTSAWTQARGKGSGQWTIQRFNGSRALLHTLPAPEASPFNAFVSLRVAPSQLCQQAPVGWPYGACTAHLLITGVSVVPAAQSWHW